MRANGEIESKVFAILEMLNKAFLNRDVDNALDLFASDPDVFFVASEPGETALGKTELKALFQKLFSRPEAYSWKWRRRVVSSSGAVAWVVAETLIQVHKGADIQEYPYRLTAVFEKRGVNWLCLHFHGSEPVE